MLHENSIENQVRAMRKDEYIMENQTQQINDLRQKLADVLELSENAHYLVSDLGALSTLINQQTEQIERAFYSDHDARAILKRALPILRYLTIQIANHQKELGTITPKLIKLSINEKSERLKTSQQDEN